MCREVFHYPIPGRYEYEWISIKGQGAMSSSKGIVLVAEGLVGDHAAGRPAPHDARPRPRPRALALDLGEGFPRFMDEFNAEYDDSAVPFLHLVTVAQTAGRNTATAVDMLSRGGYESAVQDRNRLERDLRHARNWAEEWAPESLRLRILEPEGAREAAAGLDDEQREYLHSVAGRLDGEMDGNEVQDILYGTAVEMGVKPKKAFAALYTVLLGKKSGPKAGPFVAGLPEEIPRERFLPVMLDTAVGWDPRYFHDYAGGRSTAESE